MGVVGAGEMDNGVQLIAYADRFGGSLAGLREVLDGPLAGLFGGVHILPFFTPFDGADAGFDPVDHTEVDPRLGSWDDVRALAQEYVLMVDLIVNTSRQTPWSSGTCWPTGTPHRTRRCS